MVFQIVFNLLKIKKIPENWLTKYIYVYNLRRRLWRNVFGRTTKTTMMHHLTLKKAHIDGSIFFSKSILLVYFRALLGRLGETNNPFQKYWQFVLLEHYGHATHAWSHPRKTSWSNCSFHRYLSTWKKQTFCLK